MALRIMLDLETLSTAANAAILSIGACANDGRPDFYCAIDLESSMRAGLKVDASTIMWWMSQSDEARAALANPTHSLSEALEAFSEWLGAKTPAGDQPNSGFSFKQVECELWAFPAQFDVTILGEAYRAIGMKEPWHYRAPRCLRTAAALAPHVERTKPGCSHNALSDAKAQMEWLHNIFRALERDRQLAEAIA